MKKKLGFIFVLLVLGSPAFAQYGIFDNAVDWYSPDNPRTSVKVAGSVTVDGGLYTMEGNGDDIWNNDDEGFFVYSEKAGNWRLSARVNWFDPGGNEWAKIGVMIREKAEEPRSRHYWIDLRGAVFGDRVDAQWRTNEGGSSGNVQIFENPPDNTIALEAGGDGIWFRITRIAAIGMIYSEWSFDGVTWNLAHTANVTGWADTVAYGLAITNHDDNNVLAVAEVDNVKLEEAPAITTINRKISSRTFASGQTLDVTLDTFYSGSAAKNLTITETVPRGFTISNIGGGGSASGNTITWNATLQPGATKLTYKITAPAAYNPDTSGFGAAFSGKGETAIEGSSTIYYYNLKIGAPIISFDFENADQFNQWENLAAFWDIDGGLYLEYEDADGPLVTATGDPSLTDCSIAVDAMGLVGDGDWGIAFRIDGIGNHYSWQFVNAGLDFIKYVGNTRTQVYHEDFAEVLEEWQKFQVIAKGSVFYLLFDDEIHAVVEDSDLAAGQVGLFGWVNSGSALTGDYTAYLAFDNFVVNQISEGTAVSDWSLY